MRSPWSLPFLFLSVACATPARLVTTADDTVVALEQMADALASADVVALGELHQTPAVHEVHLDLLRELHERRGNVVVAMEMFERDVQNVLLQYLSGVIDEGEFLAAARPWPHYARDYRPVVEFAKQNGIVVLAANAPRPLASKVSKEGIASVAGDPNVARETTAPEDEYWDAFVESMGSHGGMLGEGAMKRFYEAQCLKDDTMAEAIVDHLQQRREAGARPLVVLFCGRFHSDHRRGTVARVLSRMPELDVRVVSSEKVDDLASGVYASPRGIADYVVVVQKEPEPPPPTTEREAARTGRPQPTAAADPHQKPAAAPAAAPAEGNPEGLRPALGLMPDYGSQEEGVRVESVRAGGSAEKAGIEDGDVIVAVGGTKVTDVQSYTEALDAQTIGKTITVRVRRGEAEVDLQVLVASRSR